jgi:hypothetical protein
MTMITFNNDEDRKNFQITMALQMLRQEVKFGHIEMTKQMTKKN